ncbi:MAG: sodium/proline symporter PutP [Spirochaetota bacterium]
MISLPSLITFIVYLVMLITIGGIFYRRTASIEDYILGGRGLGKWVTALSAQASDMSGWLLMGLPGAMYASGLPASWIAIGLFIGTVCNWKFVATRLRVYTEKTSSITLPCFFEDRFRDPTGLLRTVSALIILIFFTIYTSSGLVAAGKLFESMFHIDYRMAVTFGTLVIVVYTFLGGFLAVSWTDMIQGTLMVTAITIVPILAWQHAGGYDVIRSEMIARNIDTGLLTLTGASIVGIISTLAWGLGYFGQPHILVRFMGIREVKELRRSMSIAITWVFISLIGAVTVGLIAIPMYPGLEGGDHEKVFIYMVDKMFNPWIGGIFLAAILSAIMSTIDSQLLVSSSALTEDFYQKVIRRDAPQKRVVQVGRICVIGISVIALLMALNPDNTVLGLVAYAWGGFGAAFGPLVLFALFSRKTSWQSALAGMVTGTVVLVVWKQMGLGETMYEIVPGFIANVITMLAVNRFIPATDIEADKEFEEVRQTVKLLHS